ncbi:MAG: hypothetical protein H8E98_05595 [Bacteroidetes bacterium]|nr:hypothetical protein [Bacteroidota bacterium]
MKKDSSNKVLRWARSLAYKDVYIPEKLRSKIVVEITPETVTIKKK